MGWKALKQHFNIKHTVHIDENRIFIGSAYVSRLVEVRRDGSLEINRTWSRFLADEYPGLAGAEKALIADLIAAEDVFAESIPVYTYDGANIIELRCEAPGWPNVTHCGRIMYDNTFSTNRATVVGFAMRNAEADIQLLAGQITDTEERLDKLRKLLAQAQSDLRQLERERGVEHGPA